MNPYNVVWIIVDSVRRYHTDEDDRGRLKIMDEFAKEAVELRNVVTSAPSTVMSISAMMTSLPAYYLGRNYSDFRFDNEYFATFSSLINRFGWTTRALIMHKDIREKLRVFDMIPSRYWPKGYSHRNWWDNAKINQLLHNAIRIDGDKLPKPCFWFLDFNCRKDSATSDIVADSMRALQNAGYTKDNTIFVLCSDHGYPDPSRGITPEALKRQNMTHDVFMTDDNITIPMIISYPGCTPGQKIDETVSTLDLMPTFIDLLGIDVPDDVRSRWHGKTLVPLFRGEKIADYQGRKIRCDARFMGQSRRVSALRDDAYKYVYYHDDQREEFFDVTTFRLDEQDIASSEDPKVQIALHDFREAFEKSEAQGVSFQIDYAAHHIGKQMAQMRKRRGSIALKILVLSTAGHAFLHSLGKALRKVEPAVSIALLTRKDGFETTSECFDQVLVFMEVSDPASLGVDEAVRRTLDCGDYDLVILTYDSSAGAEFEALRVFAKTVKSGKQVMMDLNMSMSIRKGQAQRYLRTLWANRIFFFQEPSLIFYEIRKVFRTLVMQWRSKL